MIPCGLLSVDRRPSNIMSDVGDGMFDGGLRYRPDMFNMPEYVSSIINLGYPRWESSHLCFCHLGIPGGLHDAIYLLPRCNYGLMREK